MSYNCMTRTSQQECRGIIEYDGTPEIEIKGQLYMKMQLPLFYVPLMAYAVSLSV